MNSSLAVMTAVVGLGAPMAAMARWSRRRGGDTVEAIAAAFGGLGIAIVAIWSAASLFGFGPAAIVAGPLLAAAAIIALSDGHVAPGPHCPPRTLLILALIAVTFALVILVPFLPYGAERPDGVHRMSMTDWGKHLAFTTELTTSADFPMANPFLRSSGAAPYYAGFHMLAAILARAMGGANAVFPALLLVTVITALAVPVVAFVLARGLTGCDRKATTAAAIATLLGGWDMAVLGLATVRDVGAAWPLQSGLAGLRDAVPSINPDFWIHHNERQFYPPYRTTLWAPQHMFAALLAVLVIHWLQVTGVRANRKTAVVCGLLLAGCAAASAYVAVAVAVWLVAAFIGDCANRKVAPWRSPLWPVWTAAGGAAALFTLPIMYSFSGADSVRLVAHVASAGGLINGALFTALLGDNQLTRLLDTPAVLMIEFGAVGVLAVVGLRARWQRAPGPATAGLIFAVLAVIVTVTIVRPPVDGPNNLYARGLLIVWMVAVPIAVEAWCSVRRSALLRMAVVLAAVYLPYAMIGATLEGWLFWAVPRDDYAAARWISRNTPSDAVIAFSARAAPRYFTYWARRPVAYDNPRLARMFGASDAQVTAVHNTLDELLEATTRARAATLLLELEADWLVYPNSATAFAAEPSTGCLVDRFTSGPWTVAELLSGNCP